MLRAARKYIREVSRLTKPRSYELGEELLLWDFRKGETLAQWDCISDREVKGNSFASFQPNGKGSGAMFHGYLSTELPSNNAAKHSGYCAIRSRPKKPSWFESGRFNVSEFDAFELKVRGDGRRFIANVQAPDLGRKDDVWQQFVFTQGGPEWEHIRLGFGDFFVTHRGYMQDQQMSFPRENCIVPNPSSIIPAQTHINWKLNLDASSRNRSTVSCFFIAGGQSVLACRMKLLTHNMLTSHVKGVKNGYPLRILAKQVVVKAVDFNADFIARMLLKLDWSVLKTTAESLGHGSGLPESLPPDYETNNEFLKAAHHAMLEVEVVEGELECPESGRKFPISEGIPNMLLREDEV